MKHFDHLRNRLREEELLPESLSWENTQDGIFASMEEQSEVEPGFVFNRRILYVGIILLLSVIAFGIYCSSSKNVPLVAVETQSSLNQEGESKANSDIKENHNEVAIENNTQAHFDINENKNELAIGNNLHASKIETQNSKTPKPYQKEEATKRLSTSANDEEKNAERAKQIHELTASQTNQERSAKGSSQKSPTSELETFDQVDTNPTKNNLIGENLSPTYHKFENAKDIKKVIGEIENKNENAFEKGKENLPQGDSRPRAEKLNSVDPESLKRSYNKEASSPSARSRKVAEATLEEFEKYNETEDDIAGLEKKSMVLSLQFLNKMTHQVAWKNRLISGEELIEKYAAQTSQTSRGLQKKISVELGGGANYWALGTSSTVLGKEKAQYENTSMSYSTNVGLAYKFNNNISVSTGFNFYSLESKLDRVFESQYRETLENALVEIIHNPISNSERQVFADTSIMVTETRKIVHHNQIRVYNIPILINVRKPIRRLELQAGLGASISIIGRSLGRISYQDEVVDFGPNNMIYENAAQVLLLGELGINYLFKENLYIGARLNFQQSLSNWSSQDDIIMRPRILNSTLLVGKRF